MLNLFILGKIFPYIHVLKFDLNYIASCYGKIVKSYEHDDVSNDLVALALKHKALAVVSDKSKLLFYTNTFQYWSAISLDLINLTTEIARQDKIMSYFNLNTQTMKYLGILSGCASNEILYNHLINLNQKIKGDFFPELARFINSKLITTDKEEIINSIAAAISININDVDEIRCAVKLAYESFMPVEQKPLEDNISNFVLNNNHQNTFGILEQQPIHCFELFYNARRYRDVPFPDMISPLVRRRAGVLLKHKHNDCLKISFYSHRLQDKFNICKVTVDPIYPDLEVPDVDQLLNQEINASFDPDRFKLLCWIVAPNKLNYLDIAWVDKKYLLTLITLYFLLHVSYRYTYHISNY